ncbi:RNA polymerase sigma-70 factor (family 1) [Parabacteroides sp. PF5-5]|uniref:RNA polymerase sigma-70 factor n=1 Tax=unclassified Parabacteroides TaxID=2649774 RepID=UPI002474ECF1|nr:MULTISPECIES: RNA polymerase sigma-70 factor [unclassified Parabacteroides]MDH6303647.1 RNA polymerase sigma-70 factor (family 1) [Parabacteroides sp. PH5-39]MDH6314969.1 RNA polymerase sigma-70 factor (family 1) [Parabacteroides sp. PF5-13]MDH6318306.1 RNA polymerase sigma-70 factor (family 1) [Parabacteroides sp. PH5-13]MDH6321761.1 RNA polymerase sigma-70 factor (family 1) [Parabacteroides sp. PH5-8]MDH6325885.1 RNA polymerase sigma-70 factor (family 1) [Parabacteroides sp. PH5-41]
MKATFEKDINPTGQELFLQYFQQLYPRLMALSCRFVNEDVAKDMVQDAFVMLWEQKDRIQHVPTYLYKSVQNNCLNYIKHNHVVSDYAEKVRIAESRIQYLNEKTDENEVIKQVEYLDIRSKIEEALNELPPRTAEAFRLYFFEELSAKEVAEVMDISHRTVEVHVRKALSFLRNNFQNLHILLPFLFHTYF